MAVPTSIVEGFSVSHAAILDGTSGAEVADIYGIREGTVDVDTDNYDNTGDDTVLSSWSWINFATVSITSGYVPLAVLATLAGSTLTSSGSDAASQSYSLPLWNEKSMNQPTRPVLIRVPSKSNDGTPRRLDIILYKVQFNPFSFDGPSYKDGLVLSYSGKALLSGFDEKGVALTERAVGRLLSAAPL